MTSEEILQIFFVECEESLAAAETGLADCLAGTQDDDTINAVFRAVHSIKGGAGAFGFTPLQAYTHTFETLLSDVRDGTVPLSHSLTELLLRAVDVLADHVGKAREGVDAPDDADIVAELTTAQAANGGVQAEEDVLPCVETTPPSQDNQASGEDSFEMDFDSMLDDIVSSFAAPAAEVSSEQETEHPAAPEWQMHIRPHAGAMSNGSEPLLMLRELADMGGQCTVCDTREVPTLDGLDPLQGYLGWTFTMPGSVSEADAMAIFEFIGDDCSITFGPDAAIPAPRIATAPTPVPQADHVAPKAEKPAETAVITPLKPAAAPTPSPTTSSNAARAASTSQTIRIDLEKLDRLIDTVGELVIAQAMMTQRLMESGISANEELGLLETLTRDIQESAMSIRAQPIGTVFNRVPRILRELAASTGKHVRLEVIGEATELDKTVVERLGEPLTHLIRNAVDHGIEDAADRIATGKDPEGRLTLSAEHRSGRIVIRVADDGQGIDRVRVFAKAVEKGLISAEAQLSPEEIDNLIFAPGFSTASTVTSVSGRGVGMDVVRQNVKELGGRITIESEMGKGTAFVLTLPLTLAISDGMIVSVGGEKFVVPLAHVVECLKRTREDLQGMGSRAMLNMRGRFVPVVSVHEAMGKHPQAPSDDTGVLIVVDTEIAGQAALLVDEITDQRQFVIKSLDTHFRAVKGVAGATILGDGKVALILDVDGVVALVSEAQEMQAA